MRWTDNAPARLVVERTERWDLGGGAETASASGVSTLANQWHFAEGNVGSFDTYFAFLNPLETTCTARVYFRHENGLVYTVDVTLPAHARTTLASPAWLPTGSYAVTAATLNGQGMVMEQMLYGGSGWAVGTASAGTPVDSTVWRFAEGTTGYFDTYFLMMNQWPTPTTATFTFVTDAGTTVTANLWVPYGGRATLAADAVPGLSQAGFRTTVTAPMGIVVQRATYWPGVYGGLSAGCAGAEQPGSLGEGKPTGVPKEPYTLSAGVSVGAISEARAAGHISAEDAEVLAKGPPVAPFRPCGDAAVAAGTLPWYGGHLGMGRRP